MVNKSERFHRNYEIYTCYFSKWRNLREMLENCTIRRMYLKSLQSHKTFVNKFPYPYHALSLVQLFGQLFHCGRGCVNRVEEKKNRKKKTRAAPRNTVYPHGLAPWKSSLDTNWPQWEWKQRYSTSPDPRPHPRASATRKKLARKVCPSSLTPPLSFMCSSCHQLYDSLFSLRFALACTTLAPRPIKWFRLIRRSNCERIEEICRPRWILLLIHSFYLPR